MKKSHICVMLILLAGICSFYCSSSQTSPANAALKVIILRHGEKPDKGDNLSCQGFNRALQLANVLHSKFGMPDHLFVPSLKEGKSTGVARMYQTIVPYAIKYDLKIDNKYDVDDDEVIE